MEFRLYRVVYKDYKDGYKQKDMCFKAAGAHHAKMMALDMYLIPDDDIVDIGVDPSDNMRIIAYNARREALPDLSKFGKSIDIIDLKTGEKYFTCRSSFGGEALLRNAMKYTALNGLRFMKLAEKNGMFVIAYVTPVSESIYDWDKVFDPNKAAH